MLVVGNPANTNALIARTHAPDVPADRFTAMMRLDDNRAMTQLAKKLGVPVSDVHEDRPSGATTRRPSTPTSFHADVNGKPVAEQVDDAWLADTFIPTVPSAARRSSRPAARPPRRPPRTPRSTMSDSWVLGTPEDDWVSPAIVSDGSYGVPEGLISGFPVTAEHGTWEIVQGLDIDDFSRERIDASVAELADERDAVGVSA